MKKSFHTVKKAGILTAAAVLGTAALAGCGSKADTTESAAASEEATEAAGEAEASDAQLVIAGGDSAGLIAAVQAAAEGMDPSKILILAPGKLAGVHEFPPRYRYMVLLRRVPCAAP